MLGISIATRNIGAAIVELTKSVYLMIQMDYKPRYAIICR
jgi:hypothetical protein